MKRGSKAFIMIVSSLLFIVAGCSAAKTNKLYEEMMVMGLEQIEKDDLVQAKIYFEKALELKPDEDQAHILLNQTVHMQEAEKEFKQNELEVASNLLDKVLNAENGSDTLAQKATVIKEQIQEILLKEEEYLASYEKAKGLLEVQSFDESIQIINETLNQDERHPYYQDRLKDLENLKKEVETAKEEAIALAKAEEEKQAGLDRKAEEERKAAELKEQEEKKAAEKKAAEEKKAKEAEKELASKDIGILGGYWLKDTMACHFTSEYVACALAESDFITYDEIFDIKHLSKTKIEVTYEESIMTYNLIGENKLELGDGEVYNRVSKEEANVIYGGYYELP